MILRGVVPASLRSLVAINGTDWMTGLPAPCCERGAGGPVARRSLVADRVDRRDGRNLWYAASDSDAGFRDLPGVVVQVVRQRFAIDGLELGAAGIGHG